MGRSFWDILMWTIVAAMAVLIVMNAGGVAQLIATFGAFWLQETTVLTGTAYKKAS
jgi:hypothetical protein